MQETVSLHFTLKLDRPFEDPAHQDLDHVAIGIDFHPRKEEKFQECVNLPHLALKRLDQIDNVLRHHFHQDRQRWICRRLELQLVYRESSAVFEVELRRGIQKDCDLLHNITQFLRVQPIKTPLTLAVAY